MKASYLLPPGRITLFAAATVLAVLFLHGCTGVRAKYITVSYDLARKTKPPFEGTQGISIVLTRFEAGPSVKDEIGIWEEAEEKKDILRSSRPVSEAITNATYEYLRRAGFKVTLSPFGAGLGTSFTPAPDLVIHGIVEDFSAEAVSEAGSTQMVTRLKMKIFLKNTRDDSVLTVDIESSPEPRSFVSFSHDVFRDTLNDTLTESIERLFANTVLKDGLLRPAK